MTIQRFEEQHGKAAFKETILSLRAGADIVMQGDYIEIRTKIGETTYHFCIAPDEVTGIRNALSKWKDNYFRRKKEVMPSETR